MNKLSKRLESLVSFFDKDDSIVDVGCDHAYLSIYLKKNNLIKDTICSDISENALEYAKKNIAKEKLDIKTIVSDGLKDIPIDNLNTILISGMGTSTIIHILNEVENLNNINKIIIQTNNDYEKLREYMNSIDYYLEEEKEIKDRNKWYISIKYIKSVKKNTKEEIKFGFLKDESYQKYLQTYYEKIIARIPKINKDYKKYRDIKKELESIINKQ